MPVGTLRGSAQVQVSIVADRNTLVVADLAPGTIFKIFPTSQGRGAHSAAGRLFVKAGDGLGRRGKLLKSRYNGDEAPIAIVLPSGSNDRRAWTPATKRLTADTPVMATFGVLNINLA